MCICGRVLKEGLCSFCERFASHYVQLELLAVDLDVILDGFGWLTKHVLGGQLMR